MRKFNIPRIVIHYSMKNNLVFYKHPVDKICRAKIKNQKPCVLWFTGLSSSGKSTIAGAVEKKLAEKSFHTYLMDGDNVRHGLCRDLGFTDEDRNENIRRIGEVSKLMVDAGLIVLSAFISPFTENRKMVRELFESGEFIEVFVDVPISECEKRDPKGMYQKARNGLIKNFTGIGSPYQAPENAEIIIKNVDLSIDEAVEQVINYLQINNYLTPMMEM